MKYPLFLSTACSLLALVGAVRSHGGEVQISRIPNQSVYEMAYDGATDFSGITWVGGNDFYVVSNRAKAFFRLKIELEKPSGKILGASIKSKINVKTDDVSDFEGVFYNSKEERVYISAERGDAIVGVGSYEDIETVTVPEVFKNARINKSLESLTGSVALGQYWTCNEDTLKCDGEMSSGEGALVRMQMFSSKWKPMKQYAYRTDPSAMRYKGGGTGVSDLLLLPTGELLVLERVLVGLGLQVKIFQVEFQGATETTAIEHLNETEVTPLGKTLLFELYTGTTNYEGLALGQTLDDGWKSLILIADSGGQSKHELMPLRIKALAR